MRYEVETIEGRKLEFISGRLGKDPEARTINDSPACNLMVFPRGEDEPVYLTAFDKTAENACKYLVKGQEIVAVVAVTERDNPSNPDKPYVNRSVYRLEYGNKPQR